VELFVGEISSRIRLPPNYRDLLHSANLRHGTDGFTSPPNEGVMKIFSPLKIRRLRPALNPRTWVPKASTLPLDHRSRSNYTIWKYVLTIWSEHNDTFSHGIVHWVYNYMFRPCILAIVRLYCKLNKPLYNMCVGYCGGTRSRLTTRSHSPHSTPLHTYCISAC